MHYFDPKTNQTYTLHSEIRQLFPNSSLPRILNDDIIQYLGLLVMHDSNFLDSNFIDSSQ